MSLSARVLQIILDKVDRLLPEDPASLKALDDLVETEESPTAEMREPASGVQLKDGGEAGAASSSRLAS